MKEKTTNEEMNQVLKEMIQGGSSTSDNDRRAGRSYLERLSLQTEDSIAVSSPAPDEQPFSSDQAQQDKRILPDEQLPQTVSAVSATLSEPPCRTSTRQRKASFGEYRELFMTVPKIIDRQPVFVSRDTRDRIDRIVRRFGERKMSVSGF
ncbi:DUF3408 domain-containing protein [Bacteroides fragilis]